MHENSQKFAHLSQLVKIAKFCSAWPRVLPGGSIAPPNVRLNSEKSKKLIYQLLREHRSHLELHGAIFRKNYKISKIFVFVQKSSLYKHLFEEFRMHKNSQTFAAKCRILNSFM